MHECVSARVLRLGSSFLPVASRGSLCVPVHTAAVGADDAPRLPAMSVNVCTAGRNYPPAPLRLPPVLPQPPEVYFGHPQYAAVGNLFWPSAWQGQVKDSAYEMHGLKPGATKVWECVCGGGTYFSSQVHGRARSRTQPTRCMG